MELLIITIAWLLGILSGLYFKMGIAIIVALCGILQYFKRKSSYLKVFFSRKYVIIFILCYVISYLQITYSENLFKEKYKNVEEQIQVVGTIISNPINKEYSTVYTINVEEINKDKSYKNTKLLLKVKREKKQVYYNYGNKISFIATFEEPTTKRNEGGFDYKEYLKTKNIYGIVSTKPSNIKIENKNNINIIFKLANIISNKIEEKANELLNIEEASLLTGILIGDKQNLEEDIQEAFRKSSLSHMLAVSGAHVSYVTMAIGFTISKLKIGKNVGKVITIVLLLFFLLMTGQTPSVIRSCIMSIYLIIGSIFKKRVSTIYSISISMLILLILNPYCILDVGLQLSFGGTIGIVVLYPQLKKWLIKNKKEINKENNIEKAILKVKELVLITLSANIILIPITLYHFNTLSLIFFISNLLASPIMGVLIILGFITIIISFISPVLGKALSIFLSLFLNIFLKIAINTSNIPFSQIYIATPKIPIILIYYIVILLFIIYQKIKEKNIKIRIEKEILKRLKKINKKKVLAIILILITIILFYKQIPKNLKIYFIDVNQGDSTLIVTPNEKTILIDGGGSKDNKNFDIGKQTLIPYLLDKGITKLNYIIVSHFDSDHIGGLLSVMEELKVENAIICKQGKDSENYQTFKKIVKEKKIKVIEVKKRR